MVQSCWNQNDATVVSHDNHVTAVELMIMVVTSLANASICQIVVD